MTGVKNSAAQRQITAPIAIAETKYWQKIIDLARDPYVRDLLESDVINLLQLQVRSLPPQTVPEAFDRIIGDIKHVWSDRGDTSRWERSLRKLGPR